MLQVSGLHAGYGRTAVVHGLDLEVPDGGVVAVMGHNGAGKTTLLRAVMGLIKVKVGAVHLDGHDLTAAPPHRRVRKGLAYVPQGQQAFGQLTARENLQLVVDASGQGARQRHDEALDLFPALRELLGRKAGLLSGGQRQQLAIARALVTGPRLLILDEPTEGIQPSVVEEIEQAILTLSRDRGLAVLLVEQHVGFALAAAQHYYVMRSGRFSDQGSGGQSQEGRVREAMAL
ncbi:urea ABC transporter ATP-binding subunit UrtE [Cellulomonas bogoriensis]|uniref:Urea ABC transporter ATP-binding protein n=1 Tax=Cellulomonas bogoriensis 69B4 = DSM 16987 TaxID=1386082 RepID=A0A0A0C0A0_9CELL|nr:urea ABC transporter ATP-binding subunit UrtE [Cellulomonas bogoriensis]KGM14088.1 urea ABC transporter ATP-binding protein [Cellulomonas bogoriensis 69B4 = DSM 16987]